MTKRSRVNQSWRDRNPWFSSLRAARERCNNKKHKFYPGYGGRGIKCRITIREIKDLWIISAAGDMKKPSLDRKDPNGDYTFFNCRFMELSENVARGNRERSRRTPLTMTEEEKANVSFT